MSRVTELLRSLGKRLPPIARRDQASHDVPSFLAHIQAERRRSQQPGGPARGYNLTRKLTSYAFASSHGVEIPQIFGLWKSPEDIAWDELPDTVVVKSARGTGSRGVLPLRRHGDGWITITTSDEVEPQALVARLRERADRDLIGGPYFAEELLGGGAGNVLPVDVKIHAFFGEVSHVLLRHVTVHGSATPNTFRVIFPDGRDAGPVVDGLDHDPGIPAPKHLDELCATAARLSLGIPQAFVRVDLYDLDGRIVFGEFTPRPGDPMYYGPRLDERIGRIWERANRRVLDDIAGGGDQALRFGPGPRDLMVGGQPYRPPGA
jgi:hypothetical protein